MCIRGWGKPLLQCLLPYVEGVEGREGCGWRGSLLLMKAPSELQLSCKYKSTPLCQSLESEACQTCMSNPFNSWWWGGWWSSRLCIITVITEKTDASQQSDLPLVADGGKYKGEPVSQKLLSIIQVRSQSPRTTICWRNSHGGKLCGYSWCYAACQMLTKYHRFRIQRWI